MIARPIAHYLVHFGSSKNLDPQIEIPSADQIAESPESPSADDFEAIARAAREEGFAHGMAVANRQWEEKLTHERQAFELRLASERENWAREESQTLCEKIQAAFVAVEANIADCVTRILRPIVIDAVRPKIVDILAETVAVLVRGEKCPMLSISGPEDLLTALRAKLSHLSATFEYALNEAADVQVIAGQTLIESQLSAFAVCIEDDGR